MKKSVKENIGLGIIVAICVVVCLVIVGIVYISKFGVPDFTKTNEILVKIIDKMKTTDEYLQIKKEKIYDIDINAEENNIYINIDNHDLDVYSEEKKKQVVFTYSQGVLSTIINEHEIESNLIDDVLSMIFVSVATNSSYSEDNARYSMVKEILITKKLSEHGYEYSSLNGITRFSVKLKEELVLASSNEVYILPNDIESNADVLKSKLKYHFIEKPDIVFEKNISYADKLEYIIYEKGKLTNRTYESMLSLVKVLTDNNENVLNYIKKNYPLITEHGILSLDGITLNINKGIEKGVHFYDKADNESYLKIEIDLNNLMK